MKRPILTVALAVFVIQGIILTGCDSSSRKVDNAQENVQDAREDLREAKQDANQAEAKAANEQEWKEFKIDADARIEKNELRITELKSNLRRNGNEVDEAAKQRVDALETRNAEFKNRMNDYEKNRGDWESFKREFNRDMDELGNAFNNLTVDNKR